MQTQEGLAGKLNSHSLQRRGSIAIVVLIGLGLTIFAYLLIANWEQRVIDSELERRANNHAVVLQNLIDQHVQLLESLTGLFAASNEIDRRAFRRFVQPILTKHREIQAYGWNPRVRHDQRAAFLAAAREDGIQGFQITELDQEKNRIPARQRSEYVVALYLEPLAGNEQALGYDIASEELRREAVNLARDSGEAVTTRWIRLVQETEDHYGVLIVKPVYKAEAPVDTVQQRREVLQGYVLGVFRVGDLLEEALRPASPAGLDFWVYESDASPLSYFHPSRSRTDEDIRPRFVTNKPSADSRITLGLQLPGQIWSVAYKPAPAFFAAHSQYASLGVLVAGTLLTGLLGFYLARLQRDSEHANRLNSQLTAANSELKREITERFEAEKALTISEQKYRTLVENAPEAITILDVGRGCLIEVNQHAEKLFDMSRETLLSIGPAEFSPEYQPDGRRSDQAAREYIQRAVKGEAPVFEWMHCDQSGHKISCEVRLLRLPDPDQVLVRGSIVDIRSRKEAESLRERLGRILDNSTNEIFVFDADSLRFKQVNARARMNLGYSAQEFAGMTPLSIQTEFSEVRLRQQLERLRNGDNSHFRFETTHKRKDGTQYPVDVSLQFLRNELPQVFFAIIEDTTERLAAESALRESESYNRTLFEESPIGLFLCDMEGNAVDANPAFASILGRTLAESRNLNWWDITPSEFTADEKARIADLDSDGHYGPFEKEFVHEDGHRVPVRVTGRILLKDGTRYIWSSVEDITDHKLARDRIDHMAFHDALTDLPNRELLRDRLEHAIHLANRHQTHVGVMFLDIDRFKIVNDSLGHNHGDQLLIQFAERLTHQVREADTVARFGGDEFIVIAEGLSDSQQLITLAQAIIESLKTPFQIDQRELFVTTSIGLAYGPDGSVSADALIAQADIAMYKAKDSGRNNYQMHSPDMGERVATRAAMESDLRGALEREELLLNLQPILTLDNQQSVGMEALMRWRHPERGLVNPAEFIPVMEDSGMIVPASRWILAEACRYFSQARGTNERIASVSVNFSAHCFYDRCISDYVKQTLEDHGLAPNELIIEITESTLFHDPVRVNPVLKNLKDVGVQIALDDFGTGQSSLSHLRNFPIDIVKIDRAFVRDIPRDRNDCELVSAIIAMAHNLNKIVVAEGVENPDQLAFLVEKGCDRVQGFLFATPLPEKEMLAYLMETSVLPKSLGST